MTQEIVEQVAALSIDKEVSYTRTGETTAVISGRSSRRSAVLLGEIPIGARGAFEDELYSQHSKLFHNGQDRMEGKRRGACHVSHTSNVLRDVAGLHDEQFCVIWPALHAASECWK